MRSQIESGAELLARLNSKPSLHGLDDTLFVEGLRNTDVVEINGERSAGKTLLLSQLLAKCILPNRYGTVRINGCNASVILINTDHHFEISKLIELMTGIVSDAAYTNATLFTSEIVNIDSDSKIAAVVRDSLHNLRVIDCYDNEQFFLTLRTLDDILISNTEIAVLAIDSITAYYWQDRENSGVATTMDSYTKKLLKQIKVHTTRFNVATIYTRLREETVVDRSGTKKAETNSLENIVDYRVHLHRTHDSEGSARIGTLFERAVQLAKTIHYSISSNGIKWRRE